VVAQKGVLEVQEGRPFVSSMQRGLRVMAAVGTVAVLMSSTGCGGSTPPPAVAVKEAPANPPRFTYASPAEGGLTPAARWPKACDLLTDGDVRAILPEATAIDHRGFEAEIEVTADIGLARLRQMRVPQRSCWIEFELPRDDRVESAPMSSRIQVDLNAVGSQKVAQMNYDDVGEVVDSGGPGECHRIADSNYTCRTGGVVFTLDGSAAPDLRFEGQQGKTATFYGRRVLYEFVKLLVAKL
jgi:hypothetical protein